MKIFYFYHNIDMPYKDYTEQLNNSRARYETLKNDPEYKRKNLEYARKYYYKNRLAKIAAVTANNKKKEEARLASLAIHQKKPISP